MRYRHEYKNDRGLGIGWAHTYMYNLAEATNGNVVAYTEGGGFPWTYVSNGDGTFQAAPYDGTVLVKDVGAEEFVATGRDGREYHYYLDGRLKEIVDLNNNKLTMQYNGNDQLVTVTDDFGRSLQMTYYDETTDGHDHLKTATGPNGKTYTFNYRQAGEGYNLVSMEYPDGAGTREYEYDDSYDVHNLTRIVDNNGTEAATYRYDNQGRIIFEAGPDGTGAVTTDYEPAIEAFSDDFEAPGGLDPAWSATGTADIATDPDTENRSGYSGRLHPAEISYAKAEAAEQLEISFDLYIDDSVSTGDIKLHIFDSALGRDYGGWINITSAGEMNAELILLDDGTEVTHTLPIPGTLERNQWNHIEIKVKAGEYRQIVRLYVNCEYLAGQPFKRDTLELDTVAIDASATGNDIYIDNFKIDGIVADGSRQVTTDAAGNEQIITTIKDNAYGGDSFRYESVAPVSVGGGCGSCSKAGIKLKEYDADWNLRRVVDGNDVVTEMTYDSRGNMLTRTEAVGTLLERTTAYTYDSRFNKVTSITRPSVDSPFEDKLTIYTYDANGNLDNATVYGYSNGVLEGHTTLFTQNARGQITSIDGPRSDVSDVTLYVHDAEKGYLTAVTNTSGTVYYTNYDGNHNVGTITDSNGVSTFYTYDYADRIKTITTGSAVVEFFYDNVGNLEYVQMPEGNMVGYQYGDGYRLERIYDDLGNYISYEYDIMGRRIHAKYHDDTGALKKFLEFTYDHTGHLRRTINPDNSYTWYEYDNNTNATLITDPMGVDTEYDYDALNRLKQVTRAAGETESAVTAYTYDTHNNLISVVDAENKENTYTYDDFGNLLETVSPDSGTTNYAYDKAGNLVSKIDARGITVQYEYDALNRLTKVDYPTDNDTVYSYDETDVTNGIGRLTTMQDASGTTRYHYDALGNITRQQSTIEGRTYTTDYTYNLNNKMTGITSPRGPAITYTRDAVGNITAVSVGTGVTATQLLSNMTYEPFGGLKAMEHTLSGLDTTIGYDNQYRLKSISTTDPAGPTGLIERTYTHDFNGNITSIAQRDSDLTPVPESYAGSEQYQYVTGTGKLHQIATPHGTYVYSYDAAGNVLSDGMRSFFWNENSRLVKLDNGLVTQYVYNGIGRRVKKLAGGETTIYHYDLAGNLIEETDGSGVLLASYIYAGRKRVAKMHPDGSFYYYHNDHLGTPQAMTDASGAIVWQAYYTPFGQAVIDSSSTIENNFRFPGQYYDQESGLHYNYHRYYDPNTGRYTRTDPTGIQGGTNDLYVYAKNSPKNHYDISGLVPCIPRFEIIPDEPCPKVVKKECYNKCMDRSGPFPGSAEDCAKCMEFMAQATEALELAGPMISLECRNCTALNAAIAAAESSCRKSCTKQTYRDSYGQCK